MNKLVVRFLGWFNDARGEFIAGGAELFKKVKKAVVKPRKYPVNEYQVLGTEMSISVPRSIRGMMMDAVGGAYGVVPDHIVRLMESNDPKARVKAQELLATQHVNWARNGWHPALAKRMLTYTDEVNRWQVVPLMKMPVSEAFKGTFKFDISNLVVFKGEVHRMCENEFQAMKQRYHDLENPTKDEINRWERDMRGGGYAVTEKSLKRELHVKYQKAAAYFNQPVTNAHILRAKMVVMPESMGLDGTAYTLAPFNKAIGMTETVKMLGIGRPGKQKDRVIMTLHHHDDQSVCMKKSGWKLSYNILKRLPLVDKTKALALLGESAANYFKAFGNGGRLLAKLLLKIKAGDSEPDKKQAHMSVHLAALLYIVKSSAFGSMRHLLETLMSSMVGKILFRIFVPGVYASMVEDVRVPVGGVRVPHWSKLKIGDKTTGLRQPFFVALSLKVTHKGGADIGMNAADMSLVDGDGDGDKFYLMLEEILGPIIQYPWHKYVPDLSWVTYRDAPVANMEGMSENHKRVIKKLINDTDDVGKVMGDFNRAWQGFECLGKIDDKKARFLLRDLQLGLIQPSIAGKKHDAKLTDCAKSMEGWIAKVKGVYPEYKFYAKGLAEIVCSGGLRFNSQFNMILLRDKEHPLADLLVKHGWAEWVVLYGRDGNEVAEGWKVDANKILAEYSEKKGFMSNPYQRVMFDALKGIQLGAPRNEVFEQARAVISGNKFMSEFASAVGVNPRTGKQAGGLVGRMLDKWTADKGAGKDMNTSQQDVDELVSEEIPKLAKYFKIDEHMAKVFVAMCFMSYTSKRVNGLYGGLFAFDTSVLWTAGKLCDGSWLMWLAKDAEERDKEAIEEYGVSVATIDELTEKLTSAMLAKMKNIS